MERFLPLGKDSARLFACVPIGPLLALNSATKSKPLCASCLRNWSTGLIHVQCIITEVYANEYRKNQVYKLFTLADWLVTRDMSSSHSQSASGKSKEQQATIE